MNSNNLRLRDLLSHCFAIPQESISEETSVDTVEEWDSLKHLALVLALENEFDIAFTADETVEILSVPLIKAVLTDHGVFFDENK